MTEAEFTISGSDHPICPVMLEDARLASLMADDMLKLGEATVQAEYEWSTSTFQALSRITTQSVYWFEIV
jgi:7-keto-8-aminopelargonate synthetase-like enzyme